MDISILIVDDDMLMVEKLENTMDWEGLGIKMVFTARNIRQAQKCLEQFPIQILLSDIEMPQGSGLELLEWVRERNIPVECVFLSSYAYFAYAQKALQLESKEYLLKPVSNRELEHVLRRLADKIREKESTASEQMKEAYSEFWERCLLRGPEDDSFIPEAQEKGLYEKEDRIRMEIMRIFPDADHKKKKDNIRLRFIIDNVVTEFFQEKKQRLDAVIGISDFEWMLILRDGDGQDNLTETTGLLKKCLEERLKLKVCIYIGCGLYFWEVGGGRRRLEAMCQEAFPDETEILLEDEWMARTAPAGDAPWHVWEKQLCGMQDFAGTKQNVLSYLQSLWKETSVTISDMERFKRELVQLVYKYLNGQKLLISRIFDTSQFGICFDNASTSVRGMTEFVHYLFDRLDGNRRTEGRQESVVDQLKIYIEAHLKEDLSRRVLAQAVYLSEDYISRLFIAVTGISIPNYVMQRRMEKAKEYLRYSGLTVSKIAMEVGYSNFSYFSKNFRDYVGCTPNEFRKK